MIMPLGISSCKLIPPGQNGHHYADNIFKCIFWNEIAMQISLKFVPKGAFHSKLTLVQVMAWHQTDDKPLIELMLTQVTDTYMQHKGRWVK